MDELEQLLGLFVAAVVLAAAARRVGAPYPVFLALGRYDFVVAPPSAWDALRPQFHDLTVRVFERSGHTPQYEEAARFDAELVRWMQERQ